MKTKSITELCNILDIVIRDISDASRSGDEKRYNVVMRKYGRIRAELIARNASHML